MKLTISMYLIPPLLSLFASLYLAAASALRRGGGGYQNLQLAILFVWAALLPTAFICHHLFADEATLLAIERGIHFFYAFMPVIYLVTFHSLLGVRRPWMVRTSLALCVLVALTTPTNYYFSGLRRFDWGTIARGEMAFHLFGAFGLLVLGYTLWIFRQSLSRESNLLVRRRNRYFLTALSILALLTLLNIPAISGYDFYPMGNFAFIPLLILGYAALKYRLPGFRSMLHRTAGGITALLLFMILNAILFFALRPVVREMSDLPMFLVILVWFGVNLAGASKMQSVLDRMFDKSRFNMAQAEIAFFESINEGFYEVDLGGTLLSYNDLFVNILGAGGEDLHGVNFREFLDPEQADEVNTYFNRIFSTGALKAPMSREIIRRDGRRLFVETRASVMYDNLNRKIGFRGILRDVTEVKMGELEQARLQQQLMDARKMEALGTLAGGVAHDLNNILSGMSSYPDLLLEDMAAEDPLYQALMDIKQSGDRAAAVVNDLLTLARRGVSVKDSLELNQIVQEYLASPEYAHLQAAHPHVALETRLDAALPGMYGSAVQLSKALMNLVTNAFEAVEHSGQVVIATGFEIVASRDQYARGILPGRYLTLAVDDEGIGIPEEDLQRIYEPFFTSKKMGRSGSGLGMTVVWGTVEDHKGSILVDSRPNSGTRFKIFFPVAEDTVSPGEKIPTVDDYMGSGESVLVVDDVATQRIIAARMLKKLGYRTVAVASGEEAIEYLRNARVDILVLDMSMNPGIDGLETYRRVLEIHPGQKAIITSGYSETDRVREVLRLGAAVYLKKPYHKEDLGRVLKKELLR